MSEITIYDKKKCFRYDWTIGKYFFKDIVVEWFSQYELQIPEIKMLFQYGIHNHISFLIPSEYAILFVINFPILPCYICVIFNT